MDNNNLKIAKKINEELRFEIQLLNKFLSDIIDDRRNKNMFILFGNKYDTSFFEKLRELNNHLHNKLITQNYNLV